MLFYSIPALPCEGGKQYFFSHSACQATCHQPQAAEQCPFPDTEGCYCPDGLYLRDDQCVPLEDCGCLLDNGTYVDVSYLQISWKSKFPSPIYNYSVEYETEYQKTEHKTYATVINLCACFRHLCDRKAVQKHSCSSLYIVLLWHLMYLCF